MFVACKNPDGNPELINIDQFLTIKLLENNPPPGSKWKASIKVVGIGPTTGETGKNKDMYTLASFGSPEGAYRFMGALKDALANKEMYFDGCKAEKDIKEMYEQDYSR